MPNTHTPYLLYLYDELRLMNIKNHFIPLTVAFYVQINAFLRDSQLTRRSRASLVKPKFMIMYKQISEYSRRTKKTLCSFIYIMYIPFLYTHIYARKKIIKIIVLQQSFVFFFYVRSSKDFKFHIYSAYESSPLWLMVLLFFFFFFNH